MESEEQNGIEVTQLTEYIEQIAEIRNQYIKENGIESHQERFFFRGQENSQWPILPSVFRDNRLDTEASLISTACLRNPFDFSNLPTAFERLTKLQHYGLCTRLLDVTTNPLIAMYFACKKCEEIQENEETSISRKVEHGGAVYVAQAYVNSYTKPEITILSCLAEMELGESLSIENCLAHLKEHGVLPETLVQQYQADEYHAFIEVIQNNYFVIPSLSNDRLSRQSGAFVLPGCIMIRKEGKQPIGQATLIRAKRDFRTIFYDMWFYVPAECKESILDELDFYNINESSLFPELEHQLNYVKQDQEKRFIITKTEDFVPMEKCSIQVCEPNHDDHFPSEPTKEFVSATISNNIIVAGLREDVMQIFIEHMTVVDWYKKQQILSAIRLQIVRRLSNSSQYERSSAQETVNRIFSTLELQYSE